jgi:hypothetical protein
MVEIERTAKTVCGQTRIEQAAAIEFYGWLELNVMAGPERAWLFSDDPRQAWIRSRWSEADVDRRLPYVRGEETGRTGDTGKTGETPGTK